jgi:iron complex outermembrane recepter protein
MHRLRLGLALALLLAAMRPLHAQSGTIRGSVTDDAGRPLPGARITVADGTQATESRADGSFELRSVSDGSHVVRARMLGRRMSSQQVTVPSAAASNVYFVLPADPLALEAMVVSGAFNPASKLESSTAITTVNPEEIQQRAPRGTAELLKGVPGLQVMSNSGETGADVTVRGLPQTANSSFRYISLQEDGLPAFEAPGLLFAFPDAMVRLDETVARVEAVRGGSAAVFGSSTPGGIVNVISKTGGATTAGTVRTSAGSQGMGRFDANVGGPAMDGWNYNVGGYFRYDRGVRDPGFAANEGGQVRLNATHEMSNGHVRLYGKYLNERDVWYLGIPIRNYQDPQAIPGGPAIGSGTTFSRERLTLTVPDAYNPGSMITRDMNGNTTRYGMGGVDMLRELGEGWSLAFRGKLLHSENITNLMIDVADPSPISSFGPPAPKQVKIVSTGEIISDPAQVAALNGNGLMSVHGLAFVNQPVTNSIANLELARQGGSHSFTGGLYFSDYTTRLQLVQEGIFLEVADNPRMIQVGIAGPGGAFTGLTPADGFAAYNSGFYNLKNHATIGALYAGDSWHASDRLTMDLGARLDHNLSRGQNERPVNPGTVTGGVVTGQQVPAGYPAFTPTPAQSRAGLFGSGIYRTWDYTFGTWSASAGANYRLTDHLAVYGRGSRGTRIPTSQQWTFQTSDGSQITGETNKGEVETTTQAELGVKTSAERWSLLLTGFYGSSQNLITVLQRGQPNGTFAFLPISGDTRTIGAELEAAVSPFEGMQLRAVTTVQDPRFTRFRYEFFVPGTNPGSGEQVRDYSGNKLNDAVNVLSDLTASYAKSNAEVFGNLRYTGARQANRPNTVTIPGFNEVGAGVSYRIRQSRVALQGLNLLNRQAIVQMGARTGEDILRVNPDGTAVSLVTTGANAGLTTTSQYTTGLGILPRSVQLSVTFDF